MVRWQSCRSQGPNPNQQGDPEGSGSGGSGCPAPCCLQLLGCQCSLPWRGLSGLGLHGPATSPPVHTDSLSLVGTRGCNCPPRSSRITPSSRTLHLITSAKPCHRRQGSQDPGIRLSYPWGPPLSPLQAQLLLPQGASSGQSPTSLYQSQVESPSSTSPPR